jgi:hypothetical protein
MSAIELVRSRLEAIVKIEVERLFAVSQAVGLGDEDTKRLEILARAARLMDGGSLPDDSAARGASMADLLASLGEPVA